MTQNSEISMPMSAGNQTICSNCHSAMPSDLRFCRNCGFRLADGMGGYTGLQSTGTAEVAMAGTSTIAKKKRRMGGMSWIFIGLLVFFVCAAAFTAIVSPIRQGASIAKAPVVKSYIGIDEVNNTEQGVILNCVSIPGGPADKAGLLGGDVILTFDGQPIKDEDQMDEALKRTPVGKTIDIEYLRDGEKKTAKLATISLEDYRRMGKDFERRPEGRAQFGYEDEDAERIQVPGTNIFGVQLRRILPSRPADIAGVKNNDIVIEFDGVPIRTADEFLMRVRRALPYSTVKLTVMRGETEPLEKLEIPIKLGRQ